MDKMIIHINNKTFEAALLSKTSNELHVFNVDYESLITRMGQAKANKDGEFFLYENIPFMTKNTYGIFKHTRCQSTNPDTKLVRMSFYKKVKRKFDNRFEFFSEEDENFLNSLDTVSKFNL